MRKEAILIGAVALVIGILLIAANMPTPLHEISLHFDTIGGATREHVYHLQAGSTTQDRRITNLIICAHPAPGAGKWLNVSVSDGTNYMWVNTTGAVTEGYTTTGAFDLDASIESLEIQQDQSAGGASVHVSVVVQWRETP